MKNRFIRKLLVICAVMMFVCVVSIWAAAEEATPATPTDLKPEESGEITPPAEETAGEETDATDAVELIITKALRIGESWTGTMKKTKPAILKLDLDCAQHVNLLVLGRHAWITVEKSDRLTENPARTLTDNGQAVISWDAEAGSYLITIGPEEPNLMAKVNVTIMDDKAYEEWIVLQQETEDVIEETSEEPEDINEEKNIAEEEREDEAEPDPETENIEETDENKPESEIKPERHITVDVTWDVPDPIIGDTAHFEAIMEGYDELQYTVQWQYSPDEITWYDIPNETKTKMDVVVTPENNIVYWRILVYVEDSQED